MTNYSYPRSIDESKAEGMIVIDIRRPQEWAQRALAQADAEIEMTELLKQPSNYLTKDKTYLLVCAAGVRSKQATAILRQQGYDNVYAFPQAW